MRTDEHSPHSASVIPHPSPDASLLRAFVAVEVSEEVAGRAAGIVERLRGAGGGAVKWVDQSNFHLTLKFLGQTERAALPGLAEALRDLAARAAPFALEFSGVGAFPNERRPQVIWLGVGAGSEALTALAGAVEEACAALGWEREEKPYRAHLTLGRTRDPRRGVKGARRAARRPEPSRPDAALLPTLEAERESGAGVTLVHRLVLMQSQLHPNGPIYTVIDSFHLGHVASSR
jgi:2'-5' RNA ligase